MPQFCEAPPRLARLRAPMLLALSLAVGSCGHTESLTQPGDNLENGATAGGSDSPSLAVGFVGGIPFGFFQLPVNQVGSIYNGAERNARILVETGTFKSTLAGIKSRGGKVILQLT
ncbi:MAG TPA: hypothetical protein VJ808_06265, partial [Gemmatimonadales bacterium]|nr:hypothetical protein [Gemmatimonadales bacterium]